MLPLRIMRLAETDGLETRSPAKDLQEYRLLHSRPNPWMTSFAWRQQQGMSLHLWGDAYSLLRLGRDGRVERITPLHPRQVTVLRDDDGYPVYEVQPPDKTKKPVRLLAHEMHHCWLHSVNGYNGVSPITANREAIGLALGLEEYGSRLMSNGAVMSGVLKVPREAGPEARATAKKTWEEGHRGLANAHKVAVLEEGMDFTPISMKSVDAQWLEARKFQVEEIARIYGCPPELIQHTSPITSWGTGVEQRFISWMATKVDPILVASEQTLQRDILPNEDPDEVYPRYSRQALLRTDTLTRYQVYGIARQWGLKNANECRALEDENPIPGAAGNTYLDPQNMYLLPPGKELEDLTPKQQDAVRRLVAGLEMEGTRHG
jgi:HK97 family phage portal protein